MHTPSEHLHDSHNKLTPARLEAFSDGVIAIIITIAVLELKAPHSTEFSSLLPLAPLLLTYAVSFQIIGTYWNNHHHLLRTVKHISTGIMWANLHLLFWLSLIPFATAWVGENHGGATPTAFYSFILFCTALSYTLFSHQILKHAENSKGLMMEMRKHPKGAVSLILYALAIGPAYINPIISDVFILCVAVLWFIPDKRIEKYL